MRCPRCRNVMVEQIFEDLQDDTGCLYFKGWRCVTCGEVLDPLILSNRAAHPQPLNGRARQKRAFIQIGS